MVKHKAIPPKTSGEPPCAIEHLAVISLSTFLEPPVAII